MSNLQQLLDRQPNVVEFLRNSQLGTYVYPVVPDEYSNWRREQLSWGESAALLDLTYHMNNFYIKGPDALRLLSETGVNSMENFPVNMAKQFVPVAPSGHMIGDGVLFHLAEEEFVWVGRAPVISWLTYLAETGGYDVELTLDPRSSSRTYGHEVRRSVWRLQIQGPNAWAVIEKLNRGPVEDLKFFRMATINVGGKIVRTLRHGMAGAPGLELFGPYEDYDLIRETIMEAGREFGLEPVGSRAYPTVTFDSGWIPSPLPAIYTDEGLRPYREWLAEDCYEANNAIAGSFVSNDIKAYYTNPWELGYGMIVNFDHDFIGQEALKAIDPVVQRKKVTLAWDGHDLAKVLGSIGDPSLERPYQWFNMPLAAYGASNFDAVYDPQGSLVGLAMLTGYSSNAGRALSLATVDPSVQIGDQLELVWGEPDGGTSKPVVQPHDQIAVKVTVSPTPYSEVARTQYRTTARA